MAASDDRSVRLSQTFVRLAGTLVTGYDVVELLDGLVRSCVQLVDAAAGGLMLADRRGSLQVMAASSEETWLLELFELQSDQGPCVDCFRQGSALCVEDPDEQRARWPAFAPQLRQHRLGAVYALPMRLRSDRLGALNLFLPIGTVLEDGDIRIAQALADVATIALVQHRSSRADEELIAQLQTALNSRIVIEQAKGVLAEHAQVDMDAAFDILRNYARNHQQRLSDIAAGLVAGRIRPGSVSGRP